MERTLRNLFEYQRFENNSRLGRMIAETEKRYYSELSDDDLFLVSAAGEIESEHPTDSDK